MKALRALLVEDNEADAELMVAHLELHGFAPVQWHRVDTAPELRKALDRDWQIVLSDYRMPSFTALEALELVRERDRDLPFVIVSGAIGEEVAVQAMRKGARDFVGKEHLGRLGPVVERELAEAEHRRAAREAEIALARSREDFRTLADSISQLAWMADARGSIFWYNRRWFEYTGTRLEEMSGWGWMRVHHPDHLDRVVQRYRKSIETGEPWEDTFPLRSHDGSWRWFLSRALPIRDAGGAIQRWFGTNTDITGQLEAQDELRRAERGLREALEARDEFLSVASHQLKTPLSSLRLRAQGLRRAIDRGDQRVLLPGSVRELCEQTDRQIARISRLVDDMIEISRIQSGRLVLETEVLALDQWLRGQIDRLRPELGQVEVLLERCDPVSGEWDRERLEQVLNNVLTNAARYGLGRPVHVRLERIHGRVRLSVRDEGLGIPPESQERIFNRFERAISSSEVAGMGLGLFISRAIVEAHGGRIWVESEAGRGATFIIEFPAQTSGRAHAS